MARIPPSAARWQRRSSRRHRFATIDRTRLVFFVLLALILLILGSSLAGQVIDSGFLTELFIAATVFSLGVLVIDFLGLLGPHDAGAAGHMDAVTHLDSASALDHPGGLDHDGDVDSGSLHDIAHTGTAHFSEGHNADAEADEAGALPPQSDIALLVGIKYMRWSVYFCLGFGPVGWISLATGRSAGWAFVVASLAGVVSVALAQLFFRLRPADTGELPSADEMLWQQATVTIPLSHTRLGRVRVTIGLTVHEPFALAVAEGAEFHTAIACVSCASPMRASMSSRGHFNNMSHQSSRSTSLFKSISHNVMVVAVGFGVALLGVGIDTLVGIRGFKSRVAAIFGWLLLASGFLLRVWAAFRFYEHQMKVIVLSPQKHLITSGPYRFSRNPLYLGGNVFIFLGASLLLGTPGGLAITAIHLPFIDRFIRREERQLEQTFGDEWKQYRERVRRWI